MKKLLLIFFGIMFAAAIYAQQDSVVSENTTTLPHYKNISEVKLAMSSFKQKEILAMMKFQTPKFHKQFRSGQWLNGFGGVFMALGTYYFLLSMCAFGPSPEFWIHPDEMIIIPIVGLATMGGGATMVVFGQKYKKRAINNFATDIYNGKARLTQNKFQPEFNLNFTGNGVGFLVNF